MDLEDSVFKQRSAAAIARSLKAPQSAATGGNPAPSAPPCRC
jgi:hypothetical protein